MRNDLIERHKSAWSKLSTNWGIANTQWNDRTKERFKQEFWLELERHHQLVHKDMTSLLETLARAQHFLKSQDTRS